MTATRSGGVTFEQARTIIDAHLRPTWNPADGTFTVAPDGYANDRYWNVLAGAAEYVIDGNSASCLIGSPAYLVDRRSGAIREAHPHMDFEVFDGMEPAPAAPRLT